MLSLYFCCRITTKPLHSASNSNSGFFYPTPYPRNQKAVNDSQLDVLVHSLTSLAPLRFHNAVINIQIDGGTEADCSRISSVVNTSIISVRTRLRFARAASLREWQAEAHSLSDELGAGEILLVSMNHDHFYSDWNPTALDHAVQQVFGGPVSDRHGKLLGYTHAPEAISDALLNRGWHQHGDNLYSNSASVSFVDCAYIMSCSTLCYIWDSVLDAPDYLGRFDWPGVRFRNMRLVRYVCLREFFRHFDGYGHVTGMRLFSDLRDAVSGRRVPTDMSDARCNLDFYYQKWLDSYALFLRNYINGSKWPWQRRSILYRKALEISLALYQNSVLKEDANEGVVSSDEKAIWDLRSKVFYNANWIYSQIIVDIELMNVSPPLVRRIAIRLLSLPRAMLRSLGILVSSKCLH